MYTCKSQGKSRWPYRCPIAFALEKPAIAAQEPDIDGTTFFVESNDIWFFEETAVEIKYSDAVKEIFTAHEELY